MNLLTWLFAKVTYSCTGCNAAQRIPLRRVHIFERFHRLSEGQPLLIACPQCDEGVQCPSPYRTHTGHLVTVDPGHPPPDAFVHGLY
jgi:hypothetical protein